MDETRYLLVELQAEGETHAVLQLTNAAPSGLVEVRVLDDEHRYSHVFVDAKQLLEGIQQLIDAAGKAVKVRRPRKEKAQVLRLVTSDDSVTTE